MDFDTEMCLEDMLVARAAHLSERTAVTAPGRPPLSYAALYAQAVDVQRSLNRLGVGRRGGQTDRVALVLPNGPEMAAAFVAVAACAACAPLNPSYREVEFDYYLGDLKAAALITLQGWQTPARRAAQLRGIPLFELAPQLGGPAGAFTLQGAPAGRELSGVDGGASAPEELALILHTSGTTSRPKMVPLTGRHLVASAHHIRATLALTEADRCLNVMPLFHIHGLMAALLASLAAGASVVCTPGFDAGRFFGWLADEQPSWYTAVPSMHQAVLGAALPGAGQAARLRFVRSSSASLPPQVMAELESLFNAPVIEAYGMTEAAHQMASNPLPPAARKPGSVGRPAGPQIAILDASGALLPQGAAGEIAIRGPNVTPGYLERPEANREAFTNGWFRTGDEGYFDPDGYLYITGRLKEMINRGGEKVTPREVDEALMDHPAVTQAVTFAVKHPTLGEDVAAAVVLRPGAQAGERELRQFVLTRLTAQKAPSQVIFLDKIPKGASGKLQRIGLGERLKDQLRRERVEPRSEVEELLCGLWHTVLHRGDPALPAPGVYDNFFACGGDSLLAMALIARIRAAFEIDLPLGSIFREPTVAEQAVLVENLLLDQLDEAQGE
ncbi:MAG: non-ribosomal peptide synthetase [Chloroflexota bacterium]